MAEPHYVRGYRRFTTELSRRHDEDRAALLAVGGGTYEAHGEMLLRTLVGAGLKDGDALVDVGCGSGRLAWALSRSPLQVSYVGTDVVPELLAYARRRCADPSFVFLEVGGLGVPARDGSADVMAFFSVLTHLDPAEQLQYLEEARRVLRPGGMIVASYIELWRRPLLARISFRLSALKHRLLPRAFKSVASSDEKMRRMGRALGMRCEIVDAAIGQSVCVYRFDGDRPHTDA